MTGGRSYRIGEVASETGVTVETLRYYEREGLLPAVLRSGRGARRYDDNARACVRFIKQAQSVGLTLRDIKVLLKSQRNMSRGACENTRAILARRLADIEARVREMQDFRDVLRDHLEACDRALTSDHADECPTLGAIARGDSGRAGARSR